MLGVSTLTLGSSTAMVVQSQAQHANLDGKVLALPGSKRQSLSYKTESLLFGLMPSTISFKESRPVRPFTTAVASVDSDQISSSDPANKNETKKYYFLVANAKFMLDEEEHFQEQLFERLRYYGERDKEQDFWLMIEPKFLDKFPDITKRLKRPAVALVSTNGPWITFMKLRLDRVLTDSFDAEEGLEEALASNPSNLEFDKPDKKWVAPYPKYEPGWWERFLPPGQNEIEKARFEVHQLHESDMKRAMAGPTTTGVNLDIPESIGLSAPLPPSLSSRLVDIDTRRRRKRRV